MPPIADALMKAIGPIAIGKKDGDDVKWDVPNFGQVGLGNGKMQMMKFVPSGAETETPNGGTWTLGDRPDLGYMEHDSTLGRSAGSSTRMNLGGIGQFITENNQEKGTGLLDFSKALFPFLELPPPKSEEKSPHSVLSPEEQRLAEIYYPKPRSYLDLKEDLSPLPFEEIAPEKRIKTDDDESFSNPFDQIKSRAGYARFRALASKTQVEDSDLLPTKPDNPFAKEVGVAPDGNELSSSSEKDTQPLNTMRLGKQAKTSDVPIPIADLGLSEKQIYELCSKFAPVAARHCYANKVDPQFLARCRGYATDCAKFQAQAKPLGALANSFSSGVGLTYYNWGVKGIPYYAINEEGAIGNGRNGKVDFGTWGGGYSDEVGARDFWSQTQEYGANWYEGMYGWKQGWSVPIINSMGVEGASGTMVNVPLKEGSLGKPISVTNSYSVGPYLGLADKVGVDWYNGGVSLQRGFSVPLVGVGVSTGVGVGFPSIGTMMNRMGLNGVQANPQLFSTSSGFDSSIGLSSKQESSLSATNNGQPLLGNLIALAEMAKKREKSKKY
ncbi:unnamed protein product, partial [Mesorhabditis belari]|uniref:Uncharacterized protein n=1 Tax=Mesorhabditis belari TaxID=2138241 RepID=A0AAF3F004_9BILA